MTSLVKKFPYGFVIGASLATAAFLIGSNYDEYNYGTGRNIKADEASPDNAVCRVRANNMGRNRSAAEQTYRVEIVGKGDIVLADWTYAKHPSQDNFIDPSMATSSLVANVQVNFKANTCTVFSNLGKIFGSTVYKIEPLAPIKVASEENNCEMRQHSLSSGESLYEVKIKGALKNRTWTFSAEDGQKAVNGAANKLGNNLLDDYLEVDLAAKTCTVTNTFSHAKITPALIFTMK